MIRVGVVGAGLIGKERLLAIQQLAAEGQPVQLAGICEANREISDALASQFQAPVFHQLEDLLRLAPDWLIVALPHDTAVPAALASLERGANVLLEKPLGRDLAEARRLCLAGGDRLRVGFNYRFFPGVRRALQDARQGAFGKLIAADFVLGHGGAPGQETTWKLDSERAGGGCLIDPGVHLLDLCLLLAPQNFQVAGGTSWSGFWKTGIEEDVHVLLCTADGLSVSIQVSIVRWRSTFSMSLHGTDGYGVVAGRNRSYGPQTYHRGPRWGWREAKDQASSEKLILTSNGLDVFKDEMQALLFPGAFPGDPWPLPCTAGQALDAMEVLDRIRQELSLRRCFSEESFDAIDNAGIGGSMDQDGNIAELRVWGRASL
jgi:predicted dehydrogenase